MKVGDNVSFKFNGKIYDGEVHAVDRHGIFFSRKSSVDIMVNSENMLYKHIPIKDVVKTDRPKDSKEVQINIHASYRSGNMKQEIWDPSTIQVPINFTLDDTIKYIKENYVETKRAELESKGCENVDVDLFKMTVSPDFDCPDKEEDLEL